MSSCADWQKGKAKKAALTFVSEVPVAKLGPLRHLRQSVFASFLVMISSCTEIVEKVRIEEKSGIHIDSTRTLLPQEIEGNETFVKHVVEGGMLFVQAFGL